MKRHKWLGRIVKAILVLTLCLAILVTFLWWFTKPAKPDVFYSATGNIPSTPGSIIRIEPFTRMVPDNARGWRILYSTTKYDGTIAPASAIVLAPKVASGLPSNVVAWTHGTTGVAPPCAPSVMADPFANVPALKEAISEGWVVVATDYIGLGTEGPHPYLIGEGEARSALDSLRALRQMKEVSVTDKTVVWGHSQGGNAAMWTGILAAQYAPEQKLNGVAAAAPATDLTALGENAANSEVGKILSAYIITAYSSTYPDVSLDEYVRPGAKLLTQDIATRCMGGKEALFMVGEALIMRGSIFATDPGTGALGARLKENIPTGPISASLLIAQGTADPLVLPEVQDKFVEGSCSSGRSLEYQKYSGDDHLSLVEADSAYSAELVRWTRDRFENKTAQEGCLKLDR